jgi:hypothetical protein
MGCRFVAYLAAVQDNCTAISVPSLTDTAQCDQVPFCRAFMPEADGLPFVETQSEEVAWRASNWYYVATGRPPKYECRPDWLTVLTQPCDGSAATQMRSTACKTGQPQEGPHILINMHVYEYQHSYECSSGTPNGQEKSAFQAVNVSAVRYGKHMSWLLSA